MRLIDFTFYFNGHNWFGRFTSLFNKQILEPIYLNCLLEKEQPIPFGEIPWYKKLFPYVMTSKEYTKLYGCIDENIDPYIDVVWLGLLLSINVISNDVSDDWLDF